MSANVAVARQLLAKALEMPADSIPDTAAVSTLEAWDSLAHVRVIAALEATLGRPLESEEIVVIAGLPDIVAVLDRGLGMA